MLHRLLAFSTTFRAIATKSLRLLEREGVSSSCHGTRPCASSASSVEIKLTHYRNLVRVDQGPSMDVMFANGSPELDQGDQHEETGFSLFRIQPDRL
jgi:hypothetical protein